MSQTSIRSRSRRAFLKAGAVAPVMFYAPRLMSDQAREYVLTPRKQVVALVGHGYPDTEVWGYNGKVPGPVIRVRRGETVRVIVSNQLDQPTTTHWHGLRIENRMDGVPGLTQEAIEPGQDFIYEFTPPDAGTFWYHSHVNSSEQVGRGLYGALIVDEPDPPQVDRDITWVLDDWRLDRQARITDDFDHPRDASHAGQVGNTVTINGHILDELPVQTNERIRLRLINAANARIFRLRFAPHQPRIVALDGQAVKPHLPPDDTLVLGPAMRADLILDCIGSPGDRTPIVDLGYREAYELVDFLYQDEPVRSDPMPEAVQLASNDLAEPDIETARRHEVVFGGGVHGQLEGAEYRGEWLDLRTLFGVGKMWAVNGIVGEGENAVPLFRMKLGRSYLLHLKNQSVWPHPIHLHGHHFRLLSRNGIPVPERPWLDTVLLEPEDQAEVALVADNPGDWMFHCHIPEHMAAGMTTVLRVS